jgi:acetolactate synthase-1/2/3 large subunit
VPTTRPPPRAIFDAIGAVAEPDYIAIADGGDLLSFARVGLGARTYLDAGAFGCLGVGVPFAIAAALACPGRQVICVTGDGAFGINAMEIDTAVRHSAKAVFIVSNNAAWNIERYDHAGARRITAPRSRRCGGGPMEKAAINGMGR